MGQMTSESVDLHRNWQAGIYSTGVLDFVHRPIFWKLENTTFRKLDLFPSSGEREKTPTRLGPLESANLLRFLVSRIPDDGQSPKTQ
jgi:hypothetical protein